MVWSRCSQGSGQGSGQGSAQGSGQGSGQDVVKDLLKDLVRHLAKDLVKDLVNWSRIWSRIWSGIWSRIRAAARRQAGQAGQLPALLLHLLLEGEELALGPGVEPLDGLAGLPQVAPRLQRLLLDLRPQVLGWVAPTPLQNRHFQAQDAQGPGKQRA